MDRRGGDSALPDADGNSLAGVPLLLEVFDLPLFRRHDAADFIGKINAGLLSQAKGVGIFGDAADAQPLGQRIEEDVARLIDGFADTDDAMGRVLRNDPAFEKPSVEVPAAAAIHIQILRDAFLHPSHGHDDLEY